MRDPAKIIQCRLSGWMVIRKWLSPNEAAYNGLVVRKLLRTLHIICDHPWENEVWVNLAK